jgi:hypothetical protein
MQPQLFFRNAPTERVPYSLVPTTYKTFLRNVFSFRYCSDDNSEHYTAKVNFAALNNLKYKNGKKEIIRILRLRCILK